MDRYTVNPDEIYDQSVYGETPDDFLERIRHRDIAHYTVQIIPSGDWAEIKIFPEWKKRSYIPKKGEKSPEAKQRQNHKDAVNKLTRILNHNFKPYEDVFATFTCDDNHLVLDDDSGFAMAEKGIRRIKYQFRKSGIPLKAVYKIEIKRAKDSVSRYIRTADGRQLYRPHLHIVMNKGVNMRKVETAWALGRNKKIELLRWAPEGFLKLATYLCKDTKRGRRRWNSTSIVQQPPPPKNLYNHKAGGKRRVADMAINRTLHKEYFEQLLPGYFFVQSNTNINDFSNGTYIHARLARRDTY